MRAAAGGQRKRASQRKINYYFCKLSLDTENDPPADVETQPSFSKRQKNIDEARTAPPAKTLRDRNYPASPMEDRRSSGDEEDHNPPPRVLFGASPPASPARARSLFPQTPNKRDGQTSPSTPAFMRTNVAPTPVRERRSSPSDAVGSSVQVTRFHEQFETVGMLGQGSFGTCYKCTHKVDGCTYAVKKTNRRIRGTKDRQNVLKEVYALSRLCSGTEETSNIVRYFSAWLEDDYLYIQNELCDCNLKDRQRAVGFCEAELYRVLRQVGLGLKHLHSRQMTHLDIKPENVFVKGGVYKIGDFGLVVVSDMCGDVLEGDCRYMSPEMLRDDHSNLPKSDIFSLGATVYELSLGRNGELPCGGQEWRDIRAGKLRRPEEQAEMRRLQAAEEEEGFGGRDSMRTYSHAAIDIDNTGSDPTRHSEGNLLASGSKVGAGNGAGADGPPCKPEHNVSDKLYDLLKKLMHPDPTRRPTAAELLTERELLSDMEKELRQERKLSAALSKNYCKQMEATKTKQQQRAPPKRAATMPLQPTCY